MALSDSTMESVNHAGREGYVKNHGPDPGYGVPLSLDFIREAEECP
jgi:hypothetical protein